MQTEITLAVVAGIWLLILSAVVFLQIKFFNRLIKGTKKRELNRVLAEILDVQRKNRSSLRDLEKELQRLEDNAQFHVQKVGIIRFNPFKEIGGDHSFTLAILDGKDTGVVITGLHTRDRTRIYAKNVKKGKSEVELSTEEKKALKKAQKG